MYKYLSKYYKISPTFFLITVFIGVLNSALNSAFMIVVSKAMSNTDFFMFKGYYPFIFFALFAICIVLNILFYSYMIQLSTNIATEVELDILKKVRGASLNNLSLIGTEEIYITLRNVGILGEVPNKFTSLFISFLTVAGCITYLFCISWIYGLIISLLIGLFICSYVVRDKMLKDKYKAMRILQIDYYKQLGDLLHGFKDVKMSSIKSENIFSRFIEKNRFDTMSLSVKIRSSLAKASLLINYSWYLLLGIVLFILPKWGHTNLYNPSVFVLILVYILGPVSNITSFFPFMAEMKIAIDSLDAINPKLLQDQDIATTVGTTADLCKFSSLKFQDVCFTHIDQNNNKMFSLGPINLEFKAGEFVFIIGGNGSGKSTFINILTGLQKPLSGSIYYNNELLMDEHYVAYRNNISAIFSEGYLLRNNYEEFEVNQYNANFIRYLKIMKLDEILHSEDLFDRKTLLSKGQQKRLLLVLSLLMEKNVLVWDEWSAEQDPIFKEYFYRQVIPFFRNEGKTIIAITHDEQYLTFADRVIRFRDGNVVYN
jgi:cyclic peptide transporter